MARAKVRRIDFHPDDFITGIFGRLSAAEVGVYWTVCTYIYAEGGPVDEDHDMLARCLKLRRPQVKTILDSLVAAGKLQRTVIEGVTKLTQKRAQDELNAARKRIETNRNNARGGQNDEENQSEAVATASGVAERPAVQPPTTNHQDQDSDTNVSGAKAPSPPSDAPDASLKDRIWGPALDWLAKQSGKRQDRLRPVVGKWCRDHGEGRTLEALEQASRNAPLDPIPYVERILAAKPRGPTGGDPVNFLG